MKTFIVHFSKFANGEFIKLEKIAINIDTYEHATEAVKKLLNKMTEDTKGIFTFSHFVTTEMKYGDFLISYDPLYNYFEDFADGINKEDTNEDTDKEDKE